jgi:hypothetical protein
LAQRCTAAELRPEGLERAVDGWTRAADDFEVHHALARDALVAALAQPDDAAAASAAVRTLDQARTAATSVASQAVSLQPLAKAMAQDALVLRAAIASLNAQRPGVPAYLATYEEAGNAWLEIEAAPLHLEAAGIDAQESEHSAASFRFAIVGRHYLDLEAGLGVTGGLPSIPTLGMQGGTNVVQGKPVDEFVGLALVELEPLRIPWPDRSLAGVLRFPVLGIPLSRDPTQNFFAGAGLGWTGVGSIVAGPYLLRELTLRDGFSSGDALPTGTSFDAATHPTLQVGYFASASIDVLGLLHLFLPARAPTIDAVTGMERK